MSFISTNAPSTSPGSRGIRHDADRHPAADAVRARHEPVEGRRFALQRAGQHRLRALVDAVADDVAQPHPRHLLARQAEILEERAVDVVAALLLVDVRHRRRHAVHDRAELAFARRERVLHLLQVGDVVGDDVDALDRAVELAVRDDAAAQPPRAVVGVDRRPLVRDCLALQRAVDELHRRERRVAAADVLDRLPDHLLAPVAREEQETPR
jgi:hypothetical protein